MQHNKKIKNKIIAKETNLQQSKNAPLFISFYKKLVFLTNVLIFKSETI